MHMLITLLHKRTLAADDTPKKMLKAIVMQTGPQVLRNAPKINSPTQRRFNLCLLFQLFVNNKNTVRHVRQRLFSPELQRHLKQASNVTCSPTTVYGSLTATDPRL